MMKQDRNVLLYSENLQTTNVSALQNQPYVTILSHCVILSLDMSSSAL